MALWGRMISCGRLSIGLPRFWQTLQAGRLAIGRRLTTCPTFVALRGILGELTDQNAYRRHLAAHGTVDSPAEWRRFQDHVWGERQRRGRCC